MIPTYCEPKRRRRRQTINIDLGVVGTKRARRALLYLVCSHSIAHIVQHRFRIWSEVLQKALWKYTSCSYLHGGLPSNCKMGACRGEGGCPIMNKRQKGPILRRAFVPPFDKVHAFGAIHKPRGQILEICLSPSPFVYTFIK